MENILLLAPDLAEGRGGIAAVNRSIARCLLKQDPGEVTVRIIALHDCEAPRDLQGASINLCQGNMIRFALLALWSSILADRVIAGHVRMAVPLLFYPPAWRRLVIFGHGSEVTHRIRMTSRMIMRQSALVLANSHRTANRIRELLPGMDPVACPLGLAERPKKSSSTADAPISMLNVDGDPMIIGDRMLLLVGRMDSGEQQKGHRQLLRVLPMLLGDYPDLQLVFAGPGDDQDAIREYARDLGVSKQLIVAGPLDRDLLDGLYSRSYAFVMPSQQEGFGLVYLEAMSYSKPCIGCRDDGAEEVIVDQETGYLVPPARQESELASALRRLLEDPDRARSMGEAGFNRLQAHYTQTAFEQRLSVILETHR